jgi:hypothetical protein
MAKQSISSMRPGAALVALALGLAAHANARAGEGRWEGVAALPGLALPVVLDLAREGGGWAGSAIVVGRGAGAERLRRVEVGADGAVQGELAAAGGMTFELKPAADGRRLDGVWRQGGHGAPVTLLRTGAAQLAFVPAGVPLAPALAGVWRGRYDIGFGPREVTLRLAPPGATATVVGRRTTEVAFDQVLQRGAFVTLRASEFDIVLEAPWSSAAQGTLAATWQQGPFETTLTLRREGAP